LGVLGWTSDGPLREGLSEGYPSMLGNDEIWGKTMQGIDPDERCWGAVEPCWTETSVTSRAV